VIKLILGRITLGLAAAAVLATSASVIVVALAFALYALVKPFVGPAGAAAIVAAAAALMLLAAALALALAARGKSSRLSARSKDPGERLANFIREKPIAAIGAALGAGFLAVRNPKYLGLTLRTFFEGSERPKRRRR
jgi:hypothetical protein